jgi:hypothetical protein
MRQPEDVEPAPSAFRSDADPAVLAGEPVHAVRLEGGDDDLLRRQHAEWADADRVVEGQPTALGE